MPNWKKLIVSGSDANLNSLNITTDLTGSNALITNDLDVQGNIEGAGLIQVENNLDNNIIGKLIIDYGSSNNPRLGSVGGTEIDFQTDLVIRSNKGLYSDTSSTNGLIIGSQRADTPIKFLTSPATNSTYSEAMRIAGDGNVGIGTTTPNTTLVVHGNSVAIQDGTKGIHVGKSYSDFGIFGASGVGSHYNPDKITLSAANRNSGNSGYIDIYSRYGTTAGTRGDISIVAGAAATPLTSGSINFSTNNTQRAIIDFDGNVGIGTTSPSEKLEVDGNARITGDVTLSNGNALRWTSDDVRIEGTTAGDNIKFYVANTEILQLAQSGTLATITGNLTTTGNVGIGTTSPSEKLHIAGNMRLQNQLYDSTNSQGSTGQVLSKISAGTQWASVSSLYTETDTLDSVTDRGATTTNDITIGNLEVNSNISTPNNTSLRLQPSGSSGWIFLGSPTDGTKIYHYSRGDNGQNTVYDFDAGYYKINTTATNGFNLTQDTRVTGDLTVTGRVTAQEFHTEFVSASIMYESGSTKFGDTSDDLHSFTGSLNVQSSGSAGSNKIALKTFTGLDVVSLSNNNSDTFPVGSININYGSGTAGQIVGNSNKLKIRGGGNTSGEILFTNGLAGADELATINNSGIDLPGDAKHVFFGGNNTFIGERSNSTELELRGGGSTSAQTVYIDNTGNIGAGISNPDSKLHILRNDSSESAHIKVEQDGSGDAVIDYVLTDTNLWRVGIDNNSADAFKWGVGSFSSYERMSLSTAGVLTTLGLDVNGNADISGQTTFKPKHYAATDDLNSDTRSIFSTHTINNTTSNRPINYSSVYTLGGSTSNALQISTNEDYSESGMWIRQYNQNPASPQGTGWQNWTEVWTTNHAPLTKITNWDAAYTYSQVGHLPLSAGASYPLTDTLHIDSTSSGGNQAITFERSGQETYNITHGTSGLYFTHPNSSALLLGLTQGGDITVLDSSSSEYVRFDQSSKSVGIGTTSPNATFVVQPSEISFDLAGMSNGQIALGNNTSSGKAPTIGSRITSTGQPPLQLITGQPDTATVAGIKFSVREDNNTDFSTTADKPAFQFDRYTTNLMSIMRDGKIGIGTTSPSEKLTVEGNISASGDFYIDGAIFDTSNTSGTSGQVLSSTATGTAWIDTDAFSSTSSEAILIAVKNTSGGAINEGTPVYETGTVGATETLTVSPADASDSTKMPAIGILTSTLNNNGQGYAIVTGIHKGITTSPIDGVTPTTNTTLYVKAGGGLTTVKPTGATNLIQNVGKVGKVSGGSAGSIVVSSIMRSNDIPNLPEGKIWVGSNNYSVTSSLVHLDEPNERLGIGTASPTHKLEVIGDSNDTMRVYRPGNRTVLNIDADAGRTSTLAIDIAGTTQYYVGMPTQAVSGLGARFAISYQGAPSFVLEGSSGKIGIGVATPSHKLHIIDGTDSFKYGADIGNGFDGIKLTGGAPGIEFVGNGDDFIVGKITAGLAFFNSTDSSYKMILNDDGDLGIGVTTATGPTRTLDVRGGAIIAGDTPANPVGGTLEIYKNGADSILTIHEDAGTHNARIRFRAGGNDTYIQNTPSTFEIRTEGNLNSGTAPLKITSNGDVTLGYDLIVAGTVTAQEFHTEFVSASIMYESGSTKFGDTADDTHDFTGSLNVAGDVNINSNYPSNAAANDLTIGKTNTGDHGITIATSNANTAGIFFADNNHNDAGRIKYQHSNNAMRFDTNRAEAMRITSTGNVGIGTTNPSAPLSLGNGGAESLELNHNISSSSRILSYNRSNNTYRQLQLDAFEHVFKTSSSERMRITSAGNVGIGTTSESTVGGTAKMTIDVGTGTSKPVSIVNGTTDGMYIRRYDANGQYQIQTTVASGNSGNLSLQSYGGNVGIGTTSPSAKLDIEGDLQVKGVNISNQENLDVDTGTETIATVVKANYDAAFFDFVIKNGTNLRAGTVFAIHDGTNVEFTETSTNDLGDTSDVTLSVDISGTDMRLRATTTSDNWIIKSLVRTI